MTLYDQQKFIEAERSFQGMIQDQKKMLGEKHKETLNSKYWLAVILYAQRKFVQAEQLFRETIQDQEKVLGDEHIDTVSSKYCLACSLERQKRYAEAESLLEKLMQKLEKMLGKDHQWTLNGMRLQKKLLATASVTADTTSKAALRRLSEFFLPDREHWSPYTDSKIRQISLLLNQRLALDQSPTDVHSTSDYRLLGSSQ